MALELLQELARVVSEGLYRAEMVGHNELLLVLLHRELRDVFILLRQVHHDPGLLARQAVDYPHILLRDDDNLVVLCRVKEVYDLVLADNTHY